MFFYAFQLCRQTAKCQKFNLETMSLHWVYARQKQWQCYIHSVSGYVIKVCSTQHCRPDRGLEKDTVQVLMMGFWPFCGYIYWFYSQFTALLAFWVIYTSYLLVKAVVFTIFQGSLQNMCIQTWRIIRIRVRIRITDFFTAWNQNQPQKLTNSN